MSTITKSLFLLLALASKYKGSSSKTSPNSKDEWHQFHYPDPFRSLFVYSAFFDNRLSDFPLIRIIATKRNLHYWKSSSGKLETQNNDPVLCIIEDSRDLVEINGIYEVHKDWSTILPYYFAFIICPVSKKLGKVPKSVLILAPGSINETVHRMEVRDLSEPKEFRKRRDKKLAVCIPALFDEVSPIRLLEFIEFYRILGAGHFQFYIIQASDQVNCLLDHYANEELVEVLKWSTLGLRSSVEADKFLQNRTKTSFKEAHIDIQFRNQVALINDCNYRNMWNYDFVLHSDFDEFIFPKKETNLLKMLTKLENFYGKEVGAYIFLHSYHLLYWKNDDLFGKKFDSKLSLYSIRKTRRSELKISFDESSKFVVKPEVAFFSHVHSVHSLLQGKNLLVLSPEEAILHHYRKICGTDLGKAYYCTIEPSFVDRTAWRWVDKLVDNFKLVFKRLEKKCSINGSEFRSNYEVPKERLNHPGNSKFRLFRHP